MRSLSVIVVALVAVFTAVSVGGCRRPCNSSENCVRTCDCLNGLTNQRLSCAIGYRCEGDERVCEEAHDMPCEEQCALYAANQRCGVERCLSDLECQKVISCPLFDQNGQATGAFQDCTLNFRCQPEFEACQPRSTALDIDLCNNECVTGIIAPE